MSTATSGRAREYRPIPGFPGYEISSDGQVRSWIPWKGTPLPRTLRQHLNPTGYAVVRPTNADGRQATKTVHRLVALAFLDGSGEVVRHLNDDKTDNRAENLAWGSRSDNGHDSVRNGRQFPAYLTHCKRDHPLTGDNLYVQPSTGKRQCRACARLRKAAA